MKIRTNYHLEEAGGQVLLPGGLASAGELDRCCGGMKRYVTLPITPVNRQTGLVQKPFLSGTILVRDSEAGVGTELAVVQKYGKQDFTTYGTALRLSWCARIPTRRPCKPCYGIRM